MPRRALVPGKAKNSSSDGEGIYLHLARGTDSHMINENAIRSQQSRESHLTSLSHPFSTLIGGSYSTQAGEWFRDPVPGARMGNQPLCNGAQEPASASWPSGSWESNTPLWREPWEDAASPCLFWGCVMFGEGPDPHWFVSSYNESGMVQAVRPTPWLILTRWLGRQEAVMAMESFPPQVNTLTGQGQ